jgi:hypothetical protein
MTDIFQENHRINHNSKVYEFQPDLNLWIEVLSGNKYGAYAPKDIQTALNLKTFNVANIPEKKAKKIAQKDFEKRIENTKDYTQFQRVVYKGKRYIFIPTIFGTGYWAEETASGKPGKYATKSLQPELNKMVFGKAVLPTIIERFKNQNSIEAQRQLKISIGWLQLKMNMLKQGGGNIPGLLYPSNNAFISGGLYFYAYDAKTKDVLPYWDRFPIIVLLDKYQDGHIGLNLHYLPPQLRVIFLSKLLTSFNPQYSEKDNMMRLKISYDALKSSGMKYYLPCIKRYLTTHVKSKILPIEPHEWTNAVYLPMQKFEKQNQNVVWKESERIIRG